MAKKQSTAVVNPNMGLYYDRAIIAVPPGALQDGMNFRITQGKLNNLNIGWASFASFTLNGAVTLIANMHLRVGTNILILGTPTDLYKYSTSGGGSVTYITPTYATGTVAASGTAVTGTSTAWNTAPSTCPSTYASCPVPVRAGDYISFGSATQHSTTATWIKINSVNSDTSLTLASSAGTVSGGTAYTIRQTFAGTAATPWTYDVFVNAQPNSADQIYLTNGVDPVVRWNGTDTTVTSLPYLGFTCQTLCVYKNQLICANLIQGGVIKPSDMVNSDIGSPEAIGQQSTGAAGQFKISGTTDQIQAVARLGDYLMIYLQNSIIVGTYVGSPLFFAFRVGTNGKGLQSTRGLALYPAYHEFIGADTLYSFDGSYARETSNHVWRQVVSIQDPARVSLVFNVEDQSEGEYIWAVPLASDPGAGTITSPPAVAFVEHYLETVPGVQELAYWAPTSRPHSKRSFPFTSAGFYSRQSTLTWDQMTNGWNTYNFPWNDQFFAASFPLLLVGDANGQVWILNGGQDANGTALPSFVKFGRKAVADGNNRALITRVMPFVTQQSTPLQVTVNLADFAIGPATITQTVSYDQSFPEGQYFADIYRAGRYFDMQFGTAGPGQPWVLSGWDYVPKAGGMR